MYRDPYRSGSQELPTYGVERKKGKIHVERVKSDIVKGFYFPPRIYAKAKIAEIERDIEKQSFVLRFANDGEDKMVFDRLASLPPCKDFKSIRESLGSKMPRAALYFDMGTTVRAMMKIGLNCIMAYAKNTDISREAFPEPFLLIRDPRIQFKESYFKQNGFINVGSLRFGAKGTPHTVRLVHDYVFWHVYISFFGRRIGGYVSFMGPSNEKWKTMTITAPLRSKEWTIETSFERLHPPGVQVVWNDQKAIMPSLKLQYSQSELKTELLPVKPIGVEAAT